MCPIFLCGLLEFSQFFDGICLPSSRLLTTCVCPISRMCPNFQIGHICIKRSSNRTHVDVSCSSSEYPYEICTHVVNTLDPASATSRLQSLRAILLSLATPPHPTPNPTQPFRAASLPQTSTTCFLLRTALVEARVESIGWPLRDPRCARARLRAALILWLLL